MINPIAAPPADRPAHPALADTPLADLRFRTLLGAEGWARLPAVVQARFAHRFQPGQSVDYPGVVTFCAMRGAGWVLAQAVRLIGAPLPLGRGGGMAAVVKVSEDAASGGQVWTRSYARAAGRPQVIRSVKRFAGPTGLEEYLGAGFGIALRVQARASGIRFSSDHYFWRVGTRKLGWRLRLPRWLAPGTLVIDHRDLGDGDFSFALTLRHPLLGVLIRQVARFRDAALPHLPENQLPETEMCHD
ncbi:DUF4166 domain-containing protein [Altererythrobacter xixiisoli]|uniref:DUF4166 domain-containing protein n=1 Tax=Croceibacterium xixiisoli TaxID=1476466 RepID=A0A6I4TW52_9SPHN|nr:DUF4166 domain-containing protein [Croceibacterium xixiisoli]MXO99439.1 DUF4166 domain-containing protein [Croceibacterium xixiisoli]